MLFMTSDVDVVFVDLALVSDVEDVDVGVLVVEEVEEVVVTESCKVSVSVSVLV